MPPSDTESPAPTISDVPAVRLDGDSAGAAVESVAEEAPVALIYNGEPYVVVMASPADLEDLALGFSLTEGIIGSPNELEGIRVAPETRGHSLHLSIPVARVEALSLRRRNLTARTGCGLCGAETIEQALHVAPGIAEPRVVAGESVSRKALFLAMSRLPALQTINGATGATHAAAWASLTGDLQLVREDVGRHNALDKLIGAMRTRGVLSTHGFAVITSRASYEMVQKAAMAGIGVLAAVSAPTGLAIRVARETGVTLAGFLRGNRCMVYCDEAHRLTRSQDWTS